MSKVVITVDLNNQAFEDDKEGELRRVLKDFPLIDGWKLYDINGNNVGNVSVLKDD